MQDLEADSARRKYAAAPSSLAGFAAGGGLAGAEAAGGDGDDKYDGEEENEGDEDEEDGGGALVDGPLGAAEAESGSVGRSSASGVSSGAGSRIGRNIGGNDKIGFANMYGALILSKETTAELVTLQQILRRKAAEFRLLAEDCQGGGRNAGGVSGTGVGVGGVSTGSGVDEGAMGRAIGGGSPHLWLGQVEAISVRQQFAPRARQRAQELEDLLAFVLCLGYVASIETISGA